MFWFENVMLSFVITCVGFYIAVVIFHTFLW